MKNFNDLYKRKLSFISLFFPIFILITTIFLSVWQSRYYYNPYEVGLMLSNAEDLLHGKLPYKYIFIQYGILTSLIHSLALFSYEKLISINFVTSFMYGIGLFGLYFLSLILTKSLKISIYVAITSFLFHPIVILPWSNYIAFPFLIFALIFSLPKNCSIVKLFISGLFFSLAILSRESLILPIFLSILLIGYLNYNKKIFQEFIWLIYGLLTPLTIFIGYLYFNDLLTYWIAYSLKLPKIYIEYFPDANLRGSFYFFYDIIKKTGKPDFRWLLVSLIVISNFFVIIKYFLNRYHDQSNFLILSFISIFFISSAIHQREIFRLATGFIVGIIPFYFYLNKYKHETVVFIFLFFSLSTTCLRLNTGNIWFPSKNQLADSVPVKALDIFKWQLWPQNVGPFYSEIDKDLEKIKNMHCKILYQYNYTKDAFLQVISPFDQYQITPFFIDLNLDVLRSDINVKKMIESSNNLLIFFKTRREFSKAYEVNPFPKNYYAYNQYEIPENIWTEPGQKLFLLLPNNCK